MPGDIYVLSKVNSPAFQHVEVIIDASGSEWITVDAGQGNSHQSGLVRRQFRQHGLITGEFGNQARLKGWVDDTVYEVARAGIDPL